MSIEPSLMVFLATAAIEILTNVLGYIQEGTDCGLLQNSVG